MLPDPFFKTQAGTTSRNLDDECQHCPQLWSGGFCGARIQADCLHIGSDDTVRVGISASPTEWFEAVHSLGELLHLTRNPVAVLGKVGAAPTLADRRSPVRPRACDGMYSPNLAEYASLWAVRQMTVFGVVYGLETRDVSGAVFERFLLPPHTFPELYREFVLTHQSPCEQAGQWFAANHAASARWRVGLSTRVPWLRERWKAGDQRVRRLRSRAVLQLLGAAAQEGLPLRTTLYQPAQTRAVLWTPSKEDNMSGKARRPEQFFHDNEVGLHLDLRGVNGVWLWAGRCDCCSAERWSIELAHYPDYIGLTLKAGNPSAEEAWHELIQCIFLR